MCYTALVMAIQVIRFQSTDNVETVLYQLRQTSATHMLFIMPFYGRPLLEAYADAAQVRQMAESQGVRLGIVSRRPVERSVARAAGLRVYADEWLGRRQIERKWWYPPEEQYDGKPTHISYDDRKAVHFRIKPLSRWQRYGLTYGTIVGTVATIAFLAYAAWLVAPSAKVTLKPEIAEIDIVEPLIVDPRYDESNPEPNSVPGKLLVTSVKWRASVAPTDTKIVATTPARGLVTFVNKLPVELTIPAGTRVTTSGGTRVVFQTLKSATLDPLIGSEKDVEVMAIDPGVQGNVSANQINRVDGALANQVNVRNLFSMSGGGSRYAYASNEKDRERLRQHVLNGVRDQAKIEMSEQLQDGEFVVDDSIRLVVIYDELYSHFLGEDTDGEPLMLEIRAEVHGTAVNEELALSAVYDRLDNEVPDGFSIMEDTIRPQLGELLGVDVTGRVTLELLGSAVAKADLTLNKQISMITGQEPSYALAYLDASLPLRELPEIEIWPEDFGRLPYVQARIRVDVDTDLE